MDLLENTSSLEIPTQEIWSKSENLLVPLEGKMYDTRIWWSDEHIPYIVKRLKDSLGERLRGYGYCNMTQEQIFALHQEEHDVFVQEMPEFVLPTKFVRGVNDFCLVQRFVASEFQYKTAIAEHILPKESDLPNFDTRQKFYNGIEKVMKKSGKIPDMDFFLMNGKLVVFDTTGFYYDKMEGKDKTRVLELLRNFLNI